jgi:hypothetical protein
VISAKGKPLSARRKPIKLRKRFTFSKVKVTPALPLQVAAKGSAIEWQATTQGETIDAYQIPLSNREKQDNTIGLGECHAAYIGKKNSHSSDKKLSMKRTSRRCFFTSRSSPLRLSRSALNSLSEKLLLPSETDFADGPVLST